MPILPATTDDIPQLLALANSAFRGETSKKGWTHEADLIAGEARTDAAMLRDMIRHPDGTMFKVTNETGRIEACVYLQVK
ncbi:MAG: GNAT family N-acetyltransferase, partial [Saprospiraceae bacterium]